MHKCTKYYAHYPARACSKCHHGKDLTEHQVCSLLNESIGFQLRIFTCHYQEDVDRFKAYVEKVGGVWAGVTQVPFLNYLKQDIGMKQFVCLYHHDENLNMEVMC